MTSNMTSNLNICILEANMHFTILIQVLYDISCYLRAKE